MTLPISQGNSLSLDELMEECLIPGYETGKEYLTVIDRWENREELLMQLKRSCPDLKDMKDEFIEDQDWNLTWIDGFVPVEIVPGFWITPPWQEKNVPSGHERIIINPGEAFGTGTHESTQLTLRLLKKYIRENDMVMDMGCGSGILSIAAEKLGAQKVYACDFDPDICNNIKENLELNKVKKISWEIKNVLEINDYNCNLALINIQKHVIIPLLERIGEQEHIPDTLILAGLLREHDKEMTEILEQSPYKVVEKIEKNQWMAMLAIKRRSV